MSEHPIFYSDKDLDLFKGDEIGGYVRQLKKGLDETYRTVGGSIHDFRVNYPEKEFLETYKMIQTRQFAL